MKRYLGRFLKSRILAPRTVLYSQSGNGNSPGVFASFTYSFPLHER